MKLRLLSAVYLLCSSLVDASEGNGGWTYSAQSNWPNVAAQCGGISQSPIGFSQNVVVNRSLRPPRFGLGACKVWSQFSTLSAFELEFDQCEDLQLQYEDENYRLLQIHFHSPSEHTVGGGYFAAEAHLVHSKISTGELLVVGVFLAVADNVPYINNNRVLDLLWRSGGSNVTQGIKTVVKSATPFSPYTTLLPGNPAHYVYSGSLTTPPCSENVQWIVFSDPVTISATDLRLLRAAAAALLGTTVSPVGNNNRVPTQSLNNRTVYYAPGIGNAEHVHPKPPPQSNSQALLSASVPRDVAHWWVLCALAVACVAMAGTAVLSFLAHRAEMHLSKQSIDKVPTDSHSSA